MSRFFKRFLSSMHRWTETDFAEEASVGILAAFSFLVITAVVIMTSTGNSVGFFVTAVGIGISGAIVIMVLPAGFLAITNIDVDAVFYVFFVEIIAIWVLAFSFSLPFAWLPFLLISAIWLGGGIKEMRIKPNDSMAS